MADDPTGGQPPQDQPNDDTVDVPEGAQNPDAVRNAIKRHQDAAKAATAEAAQLRAKLGEYEERGKTEQQRLEERATKAERDAADAATQLAKFQVAADKSIPPKLAKFLTGSTKEELAASADELLAELAGSGTSFEGGARGSDDVPEDMNARIRRAAGRA